MKMKVKGINENELNQALYNINSDQYDQNITFKRFPEKQGNFIFFTLTVKNSKNAGSRRSHMGRRIAAACWHVHRDLFKAIYKINPDSIIVTCQERYNNEQDFLDSINAMGIILVDENDVIENGKTFSDDVIID